MAARVVAYYRTKHSVGREQDAPYVNYSPWRLKTGRHHGLRAYSLTERPNWDLQGLEPSEANTFVQQYLGNNRESGRNKSLFEVG